MLRSEMRMQAEGMPPRAGQDYGAWRENADPENLDLLVIYGTFLRGQHAGMTDALELGAVEVAARIMGDDRPDTARRLIYLHGLVREIERSKERESRE